MAAPLIMYVTDVCDLLQGIALKLQGDVLCVRLHTCPAGEFDRGPVNTLKVRITV